MPKILKVKDRSDDNVIDKQILPNVPFRGILSMRTGQGKTTILVNFLCSPDFYLNDFLGDDIKIFSPLINDDKLALVIKSKDIPEENLYTEMDNEVLDELYNKDTEEFAERTARGKKPFPKLYVFDDLSYDGSLRKGAFNMVNKIFCNGRKHNISILITSQFYSHILPSCRSNASFILLGDMSDRQLDIITEENNYLRGKNSRMNFKRMVRDVIQDKQDFIVVNYDNKKINLYLDRDFEPINYREYEDRG